MECDVPLAAKWFKRYTLSWQYSYKNFRLFPQYRISSKNLQKCSSYGKPMTVWPEKAQQMSAEGVCSQLGLKTSTTFSCSLRELWNGKWDKIVHDLKHNWIVEVFQSLEIRCKEVALGAARKDRVIYEDLNMWGGNTLVEMVPMSIKIGSRKGCHKKQTPSFQEKDEKYKSIASLHANKGHQVWNYERK